MSKKSEKRGQIPRMRDLSITEQDALIQRWRLRKDLRSAYPEIVGAMMLWVIDSYNIEQFVAMGHESHFHINPARDLIVRMEANGFYRARNSTRYRQWRCSCRLDDTRRTGVGIE